MEEGKRGFAADSRSMKTKTNRRRPLIPDLPEEIIQCILSRLPVKSVARYKCVSKSWLSLISSPRFVKTHLKMLAENADSANHRIIFSVTHTRRIELKQCLISSLMSRPRSVAQKLEYPRRSPDAADVVVVGSCNGIVCIHNKENDVFLWNPCTGKSKELPSATVEMRPSCRYHFGFGYIESEDDYKVVALISTKDLELNESIVKIYSLRANSWKRIDGFSYSLVNIATHGRFANGKMHFLSTSSGNDWWFDNCSIVSLDLKSEGYGIVEKPDYDVENFTYHRLEVVGGCLGVFCIYDTGRVDLWVQKESWTRVVSIPFFLEYIPYNKPMLIMPNGEVLVAFKHENFLVVYNPIKNSVRRVHMTNVRFFRDAHIYLESLVEI